MVGIVVIARYQMFTQVYFHKTRRAFDYHLKNAMIKALDGGKLPGIKSIDSFLKLDDYTMWNQLQHQRDDPDSISIINRNHIREIYSTSESPSQEDESELQEKKSLLDSAEICFYEDKSERLWYKLADGRNGDKEIMVIMGEDRAARPLSNFSSIVKNMGEVKQIRIYVKPEDRMKAKEVLR